MIVEIEIACYKVDKTLYFKESKFCSDNNCNYMNRESYLREYSGNGNIVPKFWQSWSPSAAQSQDKLKFLIPYNKLSSTFFSLQCIFLKYFSICFRIAELRKIVSGYDFFLNYEDFRQRNEILMSLMIGNMNKPIFLVTQGLKKVVQYFQYKHSSHSSRSDRLFTLVPCTKTQYLNIGNPKKISIGVGYKIHLAG